MPGLDGFELLKHVKAQSPSVVVAMMTGYGTIDQAVVAMRKGAVDYITKPFDGHELTTRLKQLVMWACEESLRRDQVYSQDEGQAFHGIVGQSPAIRYVQECILRAASVDSTVLIVGESGTGKELVARAIHACGPRAKEPFRPLDCGALSETLFEGELFGHVKGAFTGADRHNPGILRAAGRGTVFLDEIGELPPSSQATFLRALQEKEVRPLGGVEPVSFEARVIAATNRELEKDMAAGRFRMDLFYRLHVLPIHLPPLRERRDDIPLLVQAALAECAARTPEQVEVSSAAMDVLMNRDWPGNVRELLNCVERACLHREGPVIVPGDLLLQVQDKENARPNESHSDDEIRPLSAYEEEAVREALRKTAYNKSAAARALGISLPTLYAKMKKYEIKPPPTV